MSGAVAQISLQDTRGQIVARFANELVKLGCCNSEGPGFLWLRAVGRL